MSNNYDFAFGQRYRLSERAIETVIQQIKERYNLEVKEVKENDKGYVFIGKYGYTIGDITFDVQTGKYNSFNFHQGVVNRIIERDKAEVQKAKKRKFKIQRYKKIGVRLTAAAIAALITIGAIKTVATFVGKDDNQPVIVAEQLNTIANANDLILYTWANYAMNEVYDMAESSKYEAVQSMGEIIRNDYYNPAMMSYFNYLDQIDSGIPSEILGDSKDTNHGNFRNRCYLLDEELEQSYFHTATFDESPFANAIVLDVYGNKVIPGGMYGESYDMNGNLVITDGDVAYTVYVRAKDVPDNNYNIDNLPTDAEFVDGVAYVSSVHLDDFIKESEKTK